MPCAEILSKEIFIPPMVPLVAVKTPNEVTENLSLIDIEPALIAPRFADIALSESVFKFSTEI